MKKRTPARRLSISNTALRAAVGWQEGDYVQLSNQWAVVYIENVEKHFEVSGDVAAIRVLAKKFPTMAEAVTYALQSLAIYQKGAARNG